MDIGRAAPRYQAIALLYPRSKKLQSYLSEYFILVVQLCRYLFKYGQKSSVRQFTSSLSDSHLKGFQTDLDKWANSIKEHMRLVEAQESSRSRAVTMDLFIFNSYQRKHEAKMQVLDFCSKYDHETTWKQIRKLGNSSFHTQRLEYQQWRDSSLPSTLMCTGKLGSGKSVLLANIVDDLNLTSEKEQSMIGYFFCKYDVSESLQARTIIGSLVRQLLYAIPDLSALEKRCENVRTRLGDIEDLLELLIQGFTSRQKIYLVIDGLDECNFEEKEEVVQAIRKIQDAFEVRVCASFREEANNGLQSVTKQLLDTRIISLAENNSDIEAFIETELERRLDQGLMTIGDPTLILDIQDALLEGSHGMFLWVALQIQNLCSMKTDYDIREALENLPKDLSETFARILHKSGRLGPQLQEKTLQLVLAAYRPLTTDELREALSVTPGDASWDPSRLLHDAYSALACCGCLLVVDEEEFTVRVVHHSVTQYILDGLGGLKRMNFSHRDAQRTMADIVVTYLNYGVFGTELSRTQVVPIMAQSVPFRILQATMESSSNRRNLAMKFLKSRRQPGFDMSKAIAEVRSSFQTEKRTSFSFYEYANTYWQDLIICVSGHDPAIFRLSSKLIRTRASTLNIMDSDQWTRYRKAVNYGNKNVLGLLLQVGSIETKEKAEMGPMRVMRAALGGCKDLVETLISTTKSDINAKDLTGRTAIMLATEHANKDVVEVLLSIPGIDVDIKDYNGRTALMSASHHGKKDVVELLLDVGKADVNAKDFSGRTALMLTAYQGKKDIVELLLTTGRADVHKKDDSGHTALMIAVEQGHKDLVEILLSAGASVNVKDWAGLTPLIRAAEKGHKDVVEVLLGAGNVDLYERSIHGRTALNEAEMRGHDDVAELLRIHIASLDLMSVK
jgi:ankyrin repeat protein